MISLKTGGIQQEAHWMNQHIYHEMRFREPLHDWEESKWAEECFESHLIVIDVENWVITELTGFSSVPSGG